MNTKGKTNQIVTKFSFSNQLLSLFTIFCFIENREDGSYG